MVDLIDKAALREQARKDIESGAVTQDYQLNPAESIKVLNDALATEIVCTLRYTYHYFMATGIHSGGVASEFLEHAEQEREHSLKIAERIQQLGGKPDFNPATLVERSHAEYREGTTLEDMLREDLIAERIAIVSYREAIKYFGEKDPTSRRLMEAILEQEEEHANDLSDLLFSLNKTENDKTKAAQKGKH
jgi:bacterioferritin